MKRLFLMLALVLMPLACAPDEPAPEKAKHNSFYVPDGDPDPTTDPTDLTPAAVDECLPCDGLGFYGECAGDVLSWCDEGCLQTLDCPTTNNSECVLEDDKTGYNCVPKCESEVYFSNNCTDKDLRVCLLDAPGGSCLEPEVTLHSGAGEAKQYLLYESTTIYGQVCDSARCDVFSYNVSCFRFPRWEYNMDIGQCSF